MTSVYDSLQMRVCAPRRSVKAFWCSLVCLPRQVVSPRFSEFSSSKIMSLSMGTGRRRQCQKQGTGRRWAHAPLDNQASLIITGWSEARIAFPSSTPNTSLFTVFVSWSSVSLKSDRMTWASRPWWALTQWAWLPRNFWITLISWLGSASRSCSYTRA